MLVGVRLRCRHAFSPRGWLWRAGEIGLLSLVFSCVIWFCLSSLFPFHSSVRAQSDPLSNSPPGLLISEVHPMAEAVEEELGEWFELHNPSSDAVNLQFWSVINEGNSDYVFPFELWVAPGGYVVLAAEADVAKNGGVQPDHVYVAFRLSNQRDALSLRDPQGQTVDQVAWGEGTSLVPVSGVSLERSAPQLDAPWVLAHSPWPGSAGDWGSPGGPYVPPPTATPTPLPTSTPSPTLMPSSTPTGTPPPAVPPRLRISEIMANPAAVGDEQGEWVELFNADSVPVNLNGWVLADLDRDQATLAGDVWLQPGEYRVVARNGDAAQNGGVVAASVYSGLQLANEADELVLLAPWGIEVDRVVWGDGGVTIANGASLERTGFGAEAGWVTAYYAWSGSAGDLGSPGAPYVAAPPSTATVTPTALPTATATVTPPPAVPPRLRISEIMANPAAVGDEQGEWVEIYNADSVAVNLNGWMLADWDSDQAVIGGDVWLAPGAYGVVARNGDAAQNGGVVASYVYSGLQLANETDELRLVAPWGVVVDEVVWDDNALRVVAGASLERTAFDSTGAWVVADSPWPGSAGDRGSPGAGYVAPLTPTPSATVVATATPLPTTLPGGWGRRADVAPLVIDQVYPHGGDDEFVVLRNVGGEPLALAGWRLGDAEFPGDREGLVLLPEDVTLAPGASWVMARNAAAFRARWGRDADVEWLLLTRETALATGELALADDGDELFLLDPSGAVADAVAWGAGDFGALFLSGELDLPTGRALVRAPYAPFPTVSDVRHRFLLLPPDPWRHFTLPATATDGPVTLDGSMVARWGSLGAASNFSAGGTLPPHVLWAAAGALGLDFLAIADDDRAPLDMVIPAQLGGPVIIPAWRWQHPDGETAIVYSERAEILLGWGEFLAFLNREEALAQLPPSLARDSQRTPILAADEVSAPGNLATLHTVWQRVATPLLPAGNTTPPLPGTAPVAPHYTGLVATSGDAAALWEAMAARRGWLTSSPGLWLTLRVADGAWMGSTVTHANELTLEIQYGDRSGATAGLALWQGDHVVRQLDVPPADGRWQVTIPATPGSMLYVVATQLDGDFAVTAPIYVTAAQGGEVVINEVLPYPGADHNGDGQTNSDDEYIELVNIGSAPLALVDYVLVDAASATGGRRFVFGAERFVGAGERLLLWRKETGLSLNDDGDAVQLLDPNGEPVDQIAWEQRERGPSLSRVPDGGEWQQRTPPTPGEANESYPPPEPSEPPEPEKPVDVTDVRDPASPNFGQAWGLPGTVALAKLRGLQATVEFRAQVVVPPGYFPSAIYVADVAADEHGAPLPVAGLGIQVYLNGGEFEPMAEGDWVLVRGAVVRSFRGEMEVQIEEPGQAWPYEPGTPLMPLTTTVSAIGEALEGRLVAFTGVVTGYQGESILLGDPDDADAPSIRVTVRSSLGWRRPFVQPGEVFAVVGVVSQFGTEAPWNDGYRVLVRYQDDLVRLEEE